MRYSVFEASKLVSTKTLLLKHYYRRQGFLGVCKKCPKAPDKVQKPLGSFAAAKFSLFGKDKFDMFNISVI